MKQYQSIDHDEIKNYSLQYQDQIRSSIFRNATRPDMNISKETIKEHFHKDVPTGRGRFLKKIKDEMYAKHLVVFFVLNLSFVCGKNKILGNTYGSLFSFF